jgi:hypothetical protein
MATPVRRNGVAVGTLVAMSWEPGRRFDEEEQHLSSLAARSLAFNGESDRGDQRPQAPCSIAPRPLTGVANRARSGV